MHSSAQKKSGFSASFSGDVASVGYGKSRSSSDSSPDSTPRSLRRSASRMAIG
ncbi:hypothetical protein [Xanthomonas sp. SHU 199]|uniref:hypothetical protein n=1 Tax=Xanthomonas sp. SHU 199 TaxID=1591174 RepID=UPI0003628DD2|nr:hypothetical protein [Xanthomonas sp. SHU 199]